MRNSLKPSMRSVFLAFATAAVSLSITQPVLAATYYVAVQDSRASDANPGTESLPWKTLYSISAANLQPGDTVLVKPGNYQVTGGTWASPAINLRNSGTKEKPITIKALPRHGAIVRATGEGAALGSRMRHHIVIDGFVITSDNPKGVAVFGNSKTDKVIGVVIQNNVVHDIHNSHPFDNTDGVRVENSSYAIIRNNLIYGIHNGDTTYNAAGVKLYYSDHTLVENNEVYDSGSGIYDKAAGQYSVIRRNYIHNCVDGGLRLNSNANTGPANNAQVYGNIVNKCATSFATTDSLDKNITVFNNVFANYTSSAIKGPVATTEGRHKFYNNIFYSSKEGLTAYYMYEDPLVTMVISDYNLFVNEPKSVIGQYKTNRWFNSLPAWQTGVSRDKHSMVADAAFVSPTNSDFHLNSWSAAKGAGRVGGSPTGNPVDMGAYPTGTEKVGVLSDTNRPAAPVLVDVR